ncbi:hypothetical protein DFH09DRAFT_1271918 [Mycena vulgaris]|nr:hypothetical protein DFH09DRAFT_1271918 [Mycena vulgaris]
MHVSFHDDGEGISYLSSEIWGKFFTYLTPKEIKSVSSVCRWLHRLAIDTTLNANGILDPTVKCGIVLNGSAHPKAEGFDGLAALQLALFIPRIDRFSVTFTGTGDLISMARGMRRCRRLVQKYQSIHDISIEIQVDTSRFLVNGRLGDPLPRDFRGLLDFHGLLNTIAILPSLASFRVATGWHFDTKNMVELLPLVPRLQSSSPSLLNRSHKLYKAVSQRRSYTLKTSPTPLTFLIDTPALVLPPIYPWTMSILSSRSITALQLHMLIAASDWTVILSEIADAVPQLTDLTILGVRMPVTELIRSLTRFKELTHLTIDSALEFPCEPSIRIIVPTEPTPPTLVRLPPFPTRVDLKHLTTLAMRPEHVDVLLQAPKPLPALTSLRLRLELFDLTSKPMIYLMERVLTHFRMSKNRSLPLSLDVGANISREALMCRTLDVALSQGTIWENTFSSIEHLRVRGYGNRSPVVLARWATLFRGASSFSLAETDIPRDTVIAMVAELGKTCPRLREITIGEVIYHPADTESIQAREVLSGTGFVDLPDDVLLIILESLGSELYSLSRLSRRLHLLALPIYLARNGIPDPSEKCEFRLVNHPTGGEALSVLSSSLFLQKIKHISCHFKPGGSISCYMHHIERISAFISKLPSAEDVSLSLPDCESFDREINDVVLQRWRSVFGGLLNALLERSCTSLTIRGAPYPLKFGPSELPWPTTEATLRISSLAHTNASIRSFSFHPNSLLSYSGIHWTFSALRCSQISILSVSIVSDTLLDVISEELPNLQQLEVVSCAENLDHELLAFLCKLTGLIRLSLPLTQNIQGSAPFTERVVPTFPCLRALVAPAPFVMCFLLADAPLPMLKTLEVGATTEYSLPRGWPLSKILAALSERVPAQLAITLDITLDPMRWSHPAWLMEEFHNLIYGDDELCADSWREGIKLVNTLRLRGSGMRAQTGSACDQVLYAITPHFPALQNLSVEDGSDQFMSGWKSAIAFVLDKSPGLEKVMFGDKTVYTASVQ